MFSTSKLLHCKTTVTMFLPMSCTSPLTVAITTRACEREACASPRAIASAFSCSMKGIKCATACFITRADLTTCGKNILPSPNKSPTTPMPFISGPSMTSIGRAATRRHSSVSSSINCVMPCTKECVKRSCTGNSRHAKLTSVFLPSPLNCSAMSNSRSVASERRLSTTSSTRSLSKGSKSLYTPSCPALTIPMSMPAAIAW